MSKKKNGRKIINGKEYRRHATYPFESAAEHNEYLMRKKGYNTIIIPIDNSFALWIRKD